MPSTSTLPPNMQVRRNSPAQEPAATCADPRSLSDGFHSPYTHNRANCSNGDPLQPLSELHPQRLRWREESLSCDSSNGLYLTVGMLIEQKPWKPATMKPATIMHGCGYSAPVAWLSDRFAEPWYSRSSGPADCRSCEKSSLASCDYPTIDTGPSTAISPVLTRHLSAIASTPAARAASKAAP
jgi:hypothetical protein